MTTKRIQVIKQLYFTIITVVVLAMMIISAGYLLYIGLYAYVFTGDQVTKEYPPAPYMVSAEMKADAVTCTDTCELSEIQTQDIRTWIADYSEWKSYTPGRVDKNGLVVALSFFIVSVPLFLVHFRMLRKEHARADAEGGETTIFYVYYYIAALGTLIAAIVYGAMLIYTTLSTWVITDDTPQRTSIVREYPVENAVLQSAQSCGSVCGFTADEQRLIAEYSDDLDATETNYGSERSWQDPYSSNVAGLLVTIPFFFYHWAIIRKKNNKTEKTDSKIS